MTKSFLNFLFHLLVPTFSLSKTDTTADFLEGAANVGTAALSVIVTFFVLFKGAAGLVHWTVMHGWPIWAILAFDLPLTIYVIVQEMRFLRWQCRMWAEVFAALKARWKEEAENTKV